MKKSRSQTHFLCAANVPNSSFLREFPENKSASDSGGGRRKFTTESRRHGEGRKKRRTAQRDAGTGLEDIKTRSPGWISPCLRDSVVRNAFRLRRSRAGFLRGLGVFAFPVFGFLLTLRNSLRINVFQSFAAQRSQRKTQRVGRVDHLWTSFCGVRQAACLFPFEPRCASDTPRVSPEAAWWERFARQPAACGLRTNHPARLRRSRKR